MRSRIDSVLSLIFERVKETSNPNIWLMGGRAGIMLFTLQYSKYKFSNYFTNETEVVFQDFAEQTVVDIGPTFATGRAGISWLFTFLSKNGALDKDDRDLLCEDDKLLERIARLQLQEGNSDFLHGSVGIAHYLLY